MKALNNIRFFLFAISLLGLFANFAQNQYGLSMIYYSDMIVGFIFLTEAFVYLKREFKQSVGRAFYLFTEHLLVGALFFGWFFKYMHWPGAGILIVFGTAILFLLYLGRTLWGVFAERKNGALQNLFVTLLSLAAMAFICALAFKIMHWPGATMLMYIADLFAIILLLLLIIKKTAQYKNEKISFFSRTKIMPGKLPMVFCYWLVWCIYLQLAGFNVLPRLYSLDRPKTVMELDENRENEKVEIYMENFGSFLQNRENHAE